MTNSIYLYPHPRFLKSLDGKAILTSHVSLHLEVPDSELKIIADFNVEERIASAIRRHVHNDGKQSAVTVVSIHHRPSLHQQGYHLELNGNVITISYSEAPGLNYALVTLEQLLRRYASELSNCLIADEPDFDTRGVMLDIGRNKIPTMETLYALIDKMAELKLNHLQLYMEGYCFEYEKYKELFPDETPVTAEEFRQLNAYAKTRFIDLVPNQNCFGHMAPWLTKDVFRDLAENADGIAITPTFRLPPSTLNPLDPRSIELVTDLFDELLPNFSSDFVNINLDEPFGLGAGKSKERADEIGVGQLYIAFAGQVLDVIRKYGKKALIWGDILTKYPEIISFLPKDVTVLDWNDGYHLFDKEMLFNLKEDPHEQHNLAQAERNLCKEAVYYLNEWHDTMPFDNDPLWTVMKEGGPYHAKGHLQSYVGWLEQTGRAYAIPELKRRHPGEFR